MKAKRLFTWSAPLLAAGALLAGTPPSNAAETKSAVFGAGCFWCVEAFYEAKPGVKEVISGYAGGEKADPNYDEVSAGKTKHAEVVKVIYDPDQISYRELVDFFWKTHDPTDPRGVWPDFGPQYRSIILYETENQKTAIEASKQVAAANLDKPIATEIKPLKKFYPAEDYHQDFVKKNPNNGYVQRIFVPKMKKLLDNNVLESAL